MLETILGILITIVLVAIAIILAKLWPTFQALIPNWAMNVLHSLANDFVRWAEKEYASSPGAARYEIVLNMLEEKLKPLGYFIDTDIIKAAIEAAWFKMNAEQVTAGLKEAKADVK